MKRMVFDNAKYSVVLTKDLDKLLRAITSTADGDPIPGDNGMRPLNSIKRMYLYFHIVDYFAENLVHCPACFGRPYNVECDDCNGEGIVPAEMVEEDIPMPTPLTELGHWENMAYMLRAWIDNNPERHVSCKDAQLYDYLNDLLKGKYR